MRHPSQFEHHLSGEGADRALTGQTAIGPDTLDREVQPDPLSQAHGNRGERQHRDGC